MHFAIIGAGAVGGFYGALLKRSGQDVTFLARGAHLDAIRQHGLRVEGPIGDFTVRVTAEDDPRVVGHADVVILAVKTYDNDTALPMLPPLVGPHTTVLTLQNGVDSAAEVAGVVGEAATLAGPTYIATAVEGPGLIRQTGTHRRVVVGECFGQPTTVSPRVQRIVDAMQPADILAEAVVDSRVHLWEKFIYLAPFAAFTAAARLPIGSIWGLPDSRAAFMQAVAEVESVARATGIDVAPDVRTRIEQYTDGIPPSTRSSMLIDLTYGKRIEIESLAGSVVRRGRDVGVPTPMMSALCAVLRPHAVPQEPA